jgi:hypothetical protein
VVIKMSAVTATWHALLLLSKQWLVRWDLKHG